MKSIQKYIVSVFLLQLILLAGCSNTPQTSDDKKNNTEKLIRITRAQFETQQMMLGSTQVHTFTQNFKTNGILEASPQSKADVYSYIAGIVNSVSVNLGDVVKKGDILFTLQSKEFITLQQQYLEKLAQMKAVELDYKRLKKLYDENITSHKDFIVVESKYNILKAAIKALKAELNILHVNLSNLEKGNLLTILKIISPINGTITLQNVRIGQFVDSQELLMKIIDNSDLQLFFYVYQESINKVQTGQQLKIYTPDSPEIVYSAIVTSIGKAIGPTTKSIACRAKPEERLKDIFVDRMYFQVEVELDTIRSLAIPSSAILKVGNHNFVLVKEKEDDNAIFFRKEEVKTGMNAMGYTQILGDKVLKGVLTKGTYYFQK